MWIETYYTYKPDYFTASLPVRECGLKQQRHSRTPGTRTSLPVRECGLKQINPEGSRSVRQVTPRAGVWIETETICQRLQQVQVTPRAGVWIETSAREGCRDGGKESLPVRECGLKQSQRT